MTPITENAHFSSPLTASMMDVDVVEKKPFPTADPSDSSSSALELDEIGHGLKKEENDDDTHTEEDDDSEILTRLTKDERARSARGIVLQPTDLRWRPEPKPIPVIDYEGRRKYVTQAGCWWCGGFRTNVQYLFCSGDCYAAMQTHYGREAPSCGTCGNHLNHPHKRKEICDRCHMRAVRERARKRKAEEGEEEKEGKKKKGGK